MLFRIPTFSLLFLPLGFGGFTAAPPALPVGFQRVLKAAHMEFRSPAGTVPTPVLKNAQMDYDYAVRVPGKHIEIRYAIRPLNQLLAEYRLSKSKKVRPWWTPTRSIPR